MIDINDVMMKMIEFDKGDPARIQHFMKVYEFAHLIGVGEKVSEDVLAIIDTAAVLHDIGIHPSEEKYGDCNGKHQEEMGPSYARELLSSMDLDETFIDRVCFLIGHHHTYSRCDSIDWQILLEADFLVNSFEGEIYLNKPAAIECFRKNVFKTETGMRLLRLQYGDENESE